MNSRHEFSRRSLNFEDSNLLKPVSSVFTRVAISSFPYIEAHDCRSLVSAILATQIWPKRRLPQLYLCIGIAHR